MNHEDSRSHWPARGDERERSERDQSRRSQTCKRTAAEAAARCDDRYPERCNPTRSRPPLDEAKRDLATRYLPLARSMARKMKPGTPGSYEELESAAYFALVQAAQSFDASRNISFAAYARHRIRGALIDARQAMLGRSPSRTKDQALPRVYTVEGGDLDGIVLGAQSSAPVGAEIETHETVEECLRKLPRSHAQAFRLIYIDGRTQEETAEAVGCSAPTLSRMHSQGLTWLRHAHAMDQLA